MSNCENCVHLHSLSGDDQALCGACVAALDGFDGGIVAISELLAVSETVAGWPHADGECAIVDRARAALGPR